MRLCRFRHAGQVSAGFYSEAYIIPVKSAAAGYATAVTGRLSIPESDDLLALLPPDGAACGDVAKLAAWVADTAAMLPDAIKLATKTVELLVPVPRPPKLFLRRPICRGTRHRDSDRSKLERSSPSA